MGLDSFKSEDSNGVGRYSTRKQMENVKISKEGWMQLAHNNPSWLTYFATDWEENEVKAAIQLLDEVMKDGAPGQKLNKSEEEEMQRAKDDLIADHLED